MAKTVTPNQPGGFQDYEPARMLARQYILDTIRTVYERFGFVPLQTSTVQARQVLTGGKPNNMRIYGVAVDSQGSQPDERDLALRFDLTVPLARFVASNWDSLPHPFRRYEYGNVFRGERRQRGRYNEFAQFDVDIVDAPSLLADAEILLMMSETMRALKIEKFTIRVNNRKILNALPAYARFDENMADDVLRLLDKVDKIGVKAVTAAMGSRPSQDEEGEAIKPLGLGPEAVAKLRAFLEIDKSSNEQALVNLGELFQAVPAGLQGVNELTEILAYLGDDDQDILVDPSIVRGLGYYSGTVFETMLDDMPEIGSVCSGGRYDGLVSRFSDRLKVPALGTSVGVDRLVAGLEALGKLPLRKTSAQVCVLRFVTNDPAIDRKVGAYALGLAQELRQAGINTELYVGDAPTLTGQLPYVLNQEIPVALVIGPDELTAQQVTVKTLATKEQITIPQEKLVATVTTILA